MGKCKKCRFYDYDMLKYEGILLPTVATYFCHRKEEYFREGEECDLFEEVPTLQTSSYDGKCENCRFFNSEKQKCLYRYDRVKRYNYCDKYEGVPALRYANYSETKCVDCCHLEKCEDGMYCHFRNEYISKSAFQCCSAVDPIPELKKPTDRINCRSCCYLDFLNTRIKEVMFSKKEETYCRRLHAYIDADCICEKYRRYLY